MRRAGIVSESALKFFGQPILGLGVPFLFSAAFVASVMSSWHPERASTIISGHKTRAVFDRYNIVNESDLIDTARKIEEGGETEVGHSGAQNASMNPSQPPV